MRWMAILMCVVGCSTPKAATSPRAAAPVESKDLVLGRVVSLHSAVLDEDREYAVSLPASYDRSSTRRYPVVYVLDGERQFRHTAVDAAYLANVGEMPEAIVVGITSTVRVRDFSPTTSTSWVGGGGAGNFRKFLSSELIPAIERAYRTDGFRIVVGHSAGGLFALYCLAADPHLFQAMLAISPSLDWDNRQPIRALAEAIPTRSDVQNFVYFASSDDSGEALDEDHALAALLDTGAGHGIRGVYQPFPTTSHGGSALVGVIDGLRQLFAGYAVPQEVSDRGLAAVEAYYAELSKKLGWNAAVPSQVVSEIALNMLQAGKTAEGFELLQRILQDDPNSPDGYNSLSEAYQKTGDLAAALVAAKKARELAARFDASNLSYYDQRIARVLRKQAAAK